MTKMMKAARVHQFGKPLVIEDVPVPVPDKGEILVKVMACGVCHTDLHAAGGDWPAKPALPFTPGHEVVGVVAELGPDVTDSNWGTLSGSRGCTMPVCVANIARPAGKRCASANTIPATAATAVLPNMLSPRHHSPRGFRPG